MRAAGVWQQEAIPKPITPVRDRPGAPNGTGPFCCPLPEAIDDDEAPEMGKLRATPARPHDQHHGRDEWEYVRAGRDGSYWQGSDGLTVRVAAAERDGGVQRAQAAPQPAQTAETMQPEKEPATIARAWNLVFGR